MLHKLREFASKMDTFKTTRPVPIQNATHRFIVKYGTILNFKGQLATLAHTVISSLASKTVSLQANVTLPNQKKNLTW